MSPYPCRETIIRWLREKHLASRRIRLLPLYPSGDLAGGWRTFRIRQLFYPMTAFRWSVVR
jgi:hypothetical protein